MSWRTRIAHDEGWIGMRSRAMWMTTIRSPADWAWKWMAAGVGVQQPVAVDQEPVAAAYSPVLSSCWCPRSSCVKASHPHAGALHKDTKEKNDADDQCQVETCWLGERLDGQDSKGNSLAHQGFLQALHHGVYA